MPETELRSHSLNSKSCTWRRDVGRRSLNGQPQHSSAVSAFLLYGFVDPQEESLWWFPFLKLACCWRNEGRIQGWAWLGGSILHDTPPPPSLIVLWLSLSSTFFVSSLINGFLIFWSCTLSIAGCQFWDYRCTQQCNWRGCPIETLLAFWLFCRPLNDYKPGTGSEGQRSVWFQRRSSW